MISRCFTAALWRFALLTTLVGVANSFVTVSTPNSNRCMAQSALLDPFMTTSSSSSSSSSPVDDSGSRRNELQLQQQQQQQLPMQQAQRPNPWENLWKASSSADNMCRPQQQQSRQSTTALLGQFWSKLVESLSSSSSTATEVLLVERGDWQAYQCRAGRDSRYHYASGHVYYFNSRTGVSQWEKPHPDFPTPKAAARRGLENDPFSFLLGQTETVISRGNAQLSRSIPLATSTALWATSNDKNEGGATASTASTSSSEKSWWDTLTQAHQTLTDIFQTANKESDSIQENPQQGTSNRDAGSSKPWWSFFFGDSSANDNDGVVTSQTETEASSSSTTWWFSLFGTSSEQGSNKSSWWPFSFVDSVSESSTSESVKGAVQTALTDDSTIRSEIQYTNTAPWVTLFRGDDSSSSSSSHTKSNPQTYFESEQGELIPGKTDDSDVAIPVLHLHNPSEWVENLSLYLTKDTSRTRTLFSMKNVPLVGSILTPERTSSSTSPTSDSIKSPMDVAAAAAAAAAAATTSSPGTPLVPVSAASIRAAREQALQEKRYAASVARQANLRKNYDDVVLDRSPTISLTAMKKSSKPDIRRTWFRYLED